MKNFREVGRGIGGLVEQKNEQYGDAVAETGKILKVLYPNGVKPEQYGDLGVIVRIVDKLSRISKGNQGSESAYKDIAGYAILKYTLDSDLEEQHREAEKERTVLKAESEKMIDDIQTVLDILKDGIECDVVDCADCPAQIKDGHCGFGAVRAYFVANIVPQIEVFEDETGTGNN